jgi:DNA-binding response OmpR family regulator
MGGAPSDRVRAGEFLDSFSAHIDDGAGSERSLGEAVTTTLLCVDDSKTMRKVLEIAFAGEDYRTLLAESADDALGKLRADRPAVAVVDANLGAQSGYDLCQEIKRQAPGVGVLILSSKQQPYDKARGASVGADDFIDKPFDTQQLIDKVAAVARKATEAPAPAAAAARPMAPAAAPAPAAAAASMAARQRSSTLSYGTQSQVPATAPQAHAPAPAAAHAGISPRTPTFTGAQAQAAVHAPAPVVQAPAPTPEPPPAAPIAPTPVTGTPLHSRPAATPAVAPAPVAAAVAGDGQFAEKLGGLGLSPDQVQAVLALSRDVVEKVVWEVVPVLAETMIKEEIKRLTAE